ncbi:MAG: hypothetical protein R3F56_13390 [Planctomycetota bacterium]
MKLHALRLSSLSLALVASTAAQQLAPPFDQSYSFVSLGTPPGVPGSLGGCTFKIGDPDALFICGAANGSSGQLFRIGLTRDAQRNITGFSGPAVLVSSAANNDGGLEFGPGGVLFFTRYSMNELGMIKPGSTAPDKVVALTPLGMPASVGSLRLVPAGFPNSGKLKLASYNAGRFATADLVPDGNGTFDVLNLTLGTTPGGGPEGIFYVPPDSPQFTNFTAMLVCEYSNGAVAAYTIDGNGDPVPATRRPFLTGLSGAEGAAIDPISGNFVFSTFGGGNQVLAVRGFGLPCGAVNPYGQGLAGSGGQVPLLDTVGCFARHQTVQFTTSNGFGGAPGVFLAGLQSISVPIYGGTLLVQPFTVIAHVLQGSGAGNGTFGLPLPIPDNTHLLNTDFYFQSAYFDTGAPQSFSFTRGINLRVR